MRAQRGVGRGWLAMALCLGVAACGRAEAPTLDAAADSAPTRDADATSPRDAVALDSEHDALVADASRPTPYDTCEAPLEVVPETATTVDLAAIRQDYPTAFAGLACGGLGPSDPCLDIVLTFHLDRARDVDVTLDAGPDARTAISLRRACDASAPVVDAVGGFSTPLRHRALEPGTYFVFVGVARSSRVGAGGIPSSLDVLVHFGPPTLVLAHQTCATAALVSDGVHVEDSFVDVPSGALVHPALVYTLTTDAPANVRVTVHLNHDAPAIVGLTTTFGTTCGSGEVFYADWRADGHAEGMTRTYFELSPSTYYLVLSLEGVDLEPDFSLDVVVLPSASPPPGDTCASPLALEVGTPTLGSLSEMQYDFPEADLLGVHPRDAVHRLRLDETSDVWLRARDTSGGAAMALSVRAPCDTTSTPLSSDGVGFGPAARLLTRLGPGDYFVVVGSVEASTYELSVEAWPTSTDAPIAVADNETCSSAFEVPSEGGIFVGDTSLANDTTRSRCSDSLPPGLVDGARDVAFAWTTTTPRRVLVTTEGTRFAATLEQREPGSCAVGICAGRDSVAFRTLDLTLPAGRHVFVVDGLRAADVGPYRFQLRAL